MNILMVTMGMGIGGAETHIIELCRALTSRGVLVSVASAGGELVMALKESGAHHIYAPLDKKDPLSMMRSSAILSHEIKRNKYDIVHAHARIPAFICGVLQRRLGFRFVTSAHYDFRVNGALRKMTDWGEHTFAVSDDLRRYLLREYGTCGDNVTVTVNGIDTGHFSPSTAEDIRSSLGLREGEKMILHVSRLEDYSSLFAEKLISAMPEINATTAAKAVIIGGGEKLDELKTEAERINSALGREAVLLLGALSDVRDYIRACDVFASPSRAALEAMACAKPVIVGGSQGYIGIFDENAIYRAVSTNFCCRGEPLVQSDVLARDICRLLTSDSAYLTALGEYNRRFVLENYSASRMADDHMAVYGRLASVKTRCSEYDALICGYFGYGNMGDEAVLRGLIRGIRERKPDIRLCVMTASPGKTARAFCVDTVYRFDMARVRAAMKKSRLLIFGGGNLLQDSTSNASLRYYLYILRSARSCGMKTAVYSNGIGPVLEAANLERIAAALSACDSVSMRENRSFELAKSLCPQNKNIRLTFDPVLLRESDGKNDIAGTLGLEKGKYFVISPREIDRFSMKKLADAANLIAKKYGLRPVLIAMQRGEDLPVCRALAGDIPGSFVATENTDLQCVLALLADAAFLISSRLHTLICATSAVCPMMAYSEDVKLRSYLEYSGIAEIAGISPSADIKSTPQEIGNIADAVISRRTEIKAHIRASLPTWRALAEYEFSEIIKLIQ